jgi:hypothetical protein
MKYLFVFKSDASLCLLLPQIGKVTLAVFGSNRQMLALAAIAKEKASKKNVKALKVDTTMDGLMTGSWDWRWDLRDLICGKK